MNNNSRDKQKKEIPWAKSRAKELLKAEILAGDVNELTNYADVYYGNIEYQKYPKDRFRCNMKNLIESLKKKEKQAEIDRDAAMSDAIRFPRPEVTSRGFPFWDTSKASELLKNDVKAGLHKTMPMEAFHESREEYEAFRYQTFRKHVHQEINTQLKKSFWLKKNQQKKNDSLNI